MSEQGNGQLPLAKRTVRSRVSSGLWEQIKTAYASGIGLREIARNMDIRTGTVLARSKREGWTRQIAMAKLMERPKVARELARPEAINAISPSPMQSAALSMQQRAERHLGRMANIVEKTMPHVEAMEPGAILDRVDDVEKLDKVARRTFGISDIGSHGENVTVNIGICG
jgi:hypothetical protein